MIHSSLSIPPYTFIVILGTLSLILPSIHMLIAYQMEAGKYLFQAAFYKVMHHVFYFSNDFFSDVEKCR